MTRMLCQLVLSAFLVLATAFASAPARAAQPGHSIGSSASDGPLADLLGNDTEYGSGPIPGARTCGTPAISGERPVSLPADDAPHHSDARNYWEWWYWTGHLTATTVSGKASSHAGRRRAGRAIPKRKYWFGLVFEWKPQAHIQQVAYTLADVKDQGMHYGRSALIPGDPPRTTDGFALRAGSISAVGGDGRDRIHEEVDGYVLDIALKARKPPVLMFGDGHHWIYCQGAFYYQRQRMAIRGTLKKAGVTMRVTGNAWFDHQWGFTPAYQISQSDYLQFQLKDGSDIFLGSVRAPRFFSPAGSPPLAEVKFGSISDRQGNVTTLDRNDFTITPTGYYRPTPACSYPVEFDVAIQGRKYQVRPSLRHAEVQSTLTPLANVFWAEDPTFWDGETIVRGDTPGLGWLGLVGYCPGR